MKYHNVKWNKITHNHNMNFIESFNNILNVYRINRLIISCANWIKLSWIRFISETNKAIRGKTLCNLIRSTSGNLPAVIPSIVEFCRFIAQSTKKKLTRWTCRGFSCTWTRMTHIIYERGKFLFRKLTQPSSPDPSIPSLWKFAIRNMTHSDTLLRDSFQGHRSAHRTRHIVWTRHFPRCQKKKENGKLENFPEMSESFNYILHLSCNIWCMYIIKFWWQCDKNYNNVIMII